MRRRRTNIQVENAGAPGPEFPKLKGFTFVRCLGRGGMATVWEARQHDPERTVAVKILNDDISSSPKDVESFYGEAKTAGLLDHPNIVTVFEVGCQNGHYYYVMELAAGYDTGKWLARKGKLKETDVLTVAESVGVALDYAERTLGIIHCDIKPANIMVDGDGTVLITDMGIARFIKGAQTSEFISGTPCYMSPEQATGEAELDSRADIYSLGATIYHLLSGHALFSGKADDEILECQCTDQVPDVREFNPEVSRPCAVLLAKFLAKDRDNRPAGWGEAIEEIRAVLAYDDAKRKRKSVKGLESFSSPSTMALTDPVRGESRWFAVPRKYFWPIVAVLATLAFVVAFALTLFL